MSAILGFFLIIIVIVLVIGVSIISGILRLLFGFGKRQNYDTRRGSGARNNTGTNNNHENTSYNNQNTQNPRKKIFEDNEGEYVDYEEVKDGDKK